MLVINVPNHVVSIHAFRGEGDLAGALRRAGTEVSIHAFRGEGDEIIRDAGLELPEFQSTPSGGKATWGVAAGRVATQVSIHAFRGEGDHIGLYGTSGCGVSIHAFRGEGDAPPSRAHTPTANRVSIHAFRGEGDAISLTSVQPFRVSIHAFRGEGDALFTSDRIIFRCFNPRLPGGRRLRNLRPVERGINVSIHAFRGEGDAGAAAEIKPRGVSIHAFRGEGDMPAVDAVHDLERFNPRLPGGRRHAVITPSLLMLEFQSTPSGGKATALPSPLPGVGQVSIHAFRGEGDRTRTR